LIIESFNLSSAVQPGGNMFGYNNEENENKNKIEQLEEQIVALEDKVAQIMDVLEIQEDDSDDSVDKDLDEDSEEE
jgi:TolA-binding protein